MTGEAETPPLFHESDLQQEELKVIYALSARITLSGVNFYDL